MSTSPRDELYDLAETEKASSGEAPQDTTKEAVTSAINDYFSKQQEAAEEAEQNERQRRIDEQRAREQQELAEVSAIVKKSLQEEMGKDKQFAELVQNSDLPGGLIDYIAEVGEPEEAPLIIREIANNDSYKQKLKNTRTEVGVKRLLSQVRKAVLLGGVPEVPAILKKDIPNYNYNNSPSDYDKNYISDLAMRHGI